MSLADTLADELTTLERQGLKRTLRSIHHRAGAVVQTARGHAVDFSCNDYLGLASDPRLAEAAVRAMREQGVGAAAARLISGTTTEHEALERELAAFFDAPAALTFSSGYAANTGIIPALVGRHDVIFADRLNHASLIDGCLLSRAEVHRYDHADAASLAHLLRARRADGRRALIVTDGMFSMDGDRAPLAEIVSLAKEFDAWTYVDDAHAVGVVGANGQGSARAAGVHADVDVSVGTLGKAFGAAGAFVYGSQPLVEYLINKARSFIFSTAPLPAQAAAARMGVSIARDAAARRARVSDNARRLRAALRAARVAVPGDDDSHIIPVVIGDPVFTMHVGAELATAGYLTGAVRPPTVPVGSSRLRITASAAHTHEQIDGFVAALTRALPT